MTLPAEKKQSRLPGEIESRLAGWRCALNRQGKCPWRSFGGETTASLGESDGPASSLPVSIANCCQPGGRDRLNRR